MLYIYIFFVVFVFWVQKNALVGGIITGALLTCTSGNKGFNSDKVVEGAITGGAIATASVFLRKLTY